MTGMEPLRAANIRVLPVGIQCIHVSLSVQQSNSKGSVTIRGGIVKQSNSRLAGSSCGEYRLNVHSPEHDKRLSALGLPHELVKLLLTQPANGKRK